MDLSLFLAKLLGLYLLIVAVDMLLRKHELEGAVRDFSSSKSLLVFSGSTSLFLGLVIVLAHPVYEVDWDGLVTLLGYLLIVRGIARVCFPRLSAKEDCYLFPSRILGHLACFTRTRDLPDVPRIYCRLI